MKRVYAVQDNYRLWYVIPFELKDKFFELDEKMGSENKIESEQAYEQFNELFSQYMTGWDLNNVEIYAAI